MNTQKHLKEKKTRRKNRIRSRISGTTERPRLSVFRSLNHIQAQIVDDILQKTVVAVHDREITSVKPEKEQTKNIAKAYACGKRIAEKAKEKKITSVVFDRRGSKYHGRIAAFAKGARDGGLTF